MKNNLETGVLITGFIAVIMLGFVIVVSINHDEKFIVSDETIIEPLIMPRDYITEFTIDNYKDTISAKDLVLARAKIPYNER